MNSYARRLPGALVLAGALLTTISWQTPPAYASSITDCRFAVTAPYGVSGYDLGTLGTGSYLDWGMKSSPPRPAGIEYVQVVRLRDDLYAGALANIPDVALAQPGAYWLVGNEPDTTYQWDGQGQDNLLPQAYAERYNAVYAAIKGADPTAKVGIGGVVQPTPVRMEYLDRVLAAYRSEYDSLPPADFWHIHGFILNERPGEWGTGMPIDHAANPYQAAPVILDPGQNDNISIFQSRLVAFRSWMARNGQRYKPLWVTEYGVLMPSDSQYWYTIPIERTRDFMLNSFSFMQSAVDSGAGFPDDGAHLAQRWYWWALSADQTQIGGGLYDLSKPGPPRTILYDAYAGFTAGLAPFVDLQPLTLTGAPLTGSGAITVTLNAQIVNGGNSLSSGSFDVAFYDGDPRAGGGLISRTTLSLSLTGCQRTSVAATWPGVDVHPREAWVKLENVTGPDANSANNLLCARLFDSSTQTRCNTFDDVGTNYWAWRWVETLSASGITGGCFSGGQLYCPDDPVNRAQMAVFLERGMHGAAYTPPPVGENTGFADVPVDHWAAAWIKQLAAEGITGGCGHGN
ncbi:MAG: S-layer homology domain-containing protein, partial [Chloroflexi bacterium]|nr:S-layer homology domain-containing protein [Chloroflexota bacterium]